MWSIFTSFKDLNTIAVIGERVKAYGGHLNLIALISISYVLADYLFEYLPFSCLNKSGVKECILHGFFLNDNPFSM